MSLTAKPGIHDNDSLLTYRVGPVLCCGPTLPIVTITPPPAKLTHPPGTNSAEPGIFKHGSNIVSATDLRYRFGVKQENWKQPGQVIIAKHNDTARGYFVDEIIDVTHFPETGWGQLPAYLPRGVFSRTLVINKKIYLYAEFEKLSQLQGSGYLSDYIAHLEVQQAQNNKIVKHKPKQENSLPSKKERSISTTIQPDTTLLTSSQPKTSRLETNHLEISKTQTENSTTTDKPALPTTKAASKQPPTRSEEKNTTRISDKPASPILKKHSLRKPTSTGKTTNKTVDKKINADKNTAPGNSPIKIQPDTDIKIKTENTQPRSHQVKNSTSLPEDKKAHSEKNTNIVNTPVQEQQAEQSSSIFIFMLLALILISIGGGYYFLMPVSNNYVAATQNSNIREYSDNSRAILPAKEYTPDKKAMQAETSEHQDNISSALAASIIETQQQKKTTPQTTIEGSTKENSLSKYRANIHQNDSTITIELKGPLPPRIVNTSPTVASNEDSGKIEKEPAIQQTSPISAQKNTSGASTNRKPQTQKQHKEINKENVIEVIHIIVKGDTLWAIAKHYLQNPFLYPELAKLSRIKNPDRIYPGNRVRIIYRKKIKTRTNK